MNVRAAIVLVGCGGAAQPASNHAELQPSLYEALFRADHSWEFWPTLVEHPSTTQPEAAETTLLEPTRCTVATANEHADIRVAAITCESHDPRDLAGPSVVIAGSYLATSLGLWRIGPSSDDSQQPPLDDILLPAGPSQFRRATSKATCLDKDDSALQAVALDTGLYAVEPWRDAWCVTTVWGCHSTWSVECFRAGVGWIGGASRGYFDPVVPRWIEERWGEAPPFPYGVDPTSPAARDQ